MSAIPLSIKDYIENSKIELYLYDSLPFNVKEHNEGSDEFDKITQTFNFGSRREQELWFHSLQQDKMRPKRYKRLCQLFKLNIYKQSTKIPLIFAII